GVCSRVGDEFTRMSAGDLLDLTAIPNTWSTVAKRVNLARYAATIPRGVDHRSMYVEAGRGCPFACSFCATSPFWHLRYRVKSAGVIIEEMRWLNEVLGYDSFMLVHDLLTVNRHFLNEFSEAMQDARLPVRWMANHRTDISLEGLLPKMKSAGCWKVFMGV